MFVRPTYNDSRVNATNLMLTFLQVRIKAGVNWCKCIVHLVYRVDLNSCMKLIIELKIVLELKTTMR
jgi:hypothetical protein